MAKATYTAYTFETNTFSKPIQLSLYHNLEKESLSTSMGLSGHMFTNLMAFSEIFFCLVNSVISLSISPQLWVTQHTLCDH